MNEKPKYILIKWSNHKIYTVLENYKEVKQGDLVTCFVNKVKDVGKVVFAGEKSECRSMLQLYRNGDKKSLNKDTMTIEEESNIKHSITRKR